MKINIFQKIIIFIYVLLFCFFSIFYVPFKNIESGKIEYDILLSSSLNLDVSRLLVIIIILSILSAVFFFMFKNVNTLNFFLRMNQIKKKKSFAIFYVVILILIISGPFLIAILVSNKTDNASTSTGDQEINYDTVSSKTILPESTLKKSETCTTENAIEDFKYYMKFYYPDWKIYGNPIAIESSDCAYSIQFTTMNPHIRYRKEVMIAEITFSSDFNSYYFKTTRGVLY